MASGTSAENIGMGAPALALAPPPEAGAPEAPRAHRPDPLRAVLALDTRAGRTGAAVALAIAIGSHGALSARALTSLHELRVAIDAMRDGIHEFLWSAYDVDIEQPAPPKEEPPPPPEPEPKADPAPEPFVPPPPAAKNDAPPPPKDDPYDPPAAPAQAAKILTAPEDPDEPVDLTDQGFVSGDGTGPGYGRVAAEGVAQQPTFDLRAKVGGVPGASGSGKPGPPPVAAPGPDRSRAPGLAGGTAWNCPFPPEADVEQINEATAVILVTVRTDGTALSVRVASDPGHGFGRAARMCALSRRYTPALDRDGNPIVGTTPPIKVRFTR